MSGAFASGEDIRQIPPRSSLRNDSRPQIVAPSSQLIDLDFWIGLLKSLDDFDGDGPLIEDVRRELALFLGRRQRLFPFHLPSRL